MISPETYDFADEFKEWEGFALITSLKDMSLRTLDFSNLKDVQENVISSGILTLSNSEITNFLNTNKIIISIKIKY